MHIGRRINSLLHFIWMEGQMDTSRHRMLNFLASLKINELKFFKDFKIDFMKFRYHFDKKHNLKELKFIKNKN